jgi:hypothetical protein
MGWVNRLVVLEPGSLRQAKFVHCAAQQFRLIFAPELYAAPHLSKFIKLLFSIAKNTALRPRVKAICAIGMLPCAERESKRTRQAVVLDGLSGEMAVRNQPAAAAAVGSS